MATFIKRPSGWRAQVRRGSVSRSASFRTKAEAVAWAAKVEAEAIAGKHGQIPNVPFSTLLQKAIDELAPSKRSSDKEVMRIKRFLPLPLAKVALPELGPEHFAQWRDKRLQEVSVGTVLREWGCLSAICTVAVKEWRWLTSNPMSQVKRPQEPKARTRRVSDDEIMRLMMALGYNYEAAPRTATARVGAAFLFAIETAMRAGEICALQWDLVDFERRVAHLPMTKNGFPRDVPLSKEAVRILDQLPREGGACFQLKPANLDALFRKAKARALIEELHFHDSRREALTRLAAKVDVMTLAKISGHRDLRILQNTYYAPDMADIVGKLD